MRFPNVLMPLRKIRENNIRSKIVLYRCMLVWHVDQAKASLYFFALTSDFGQMIAAKVVYPCRVYGSIDMLFFGALTRLLNPSGKLLLSHGGVSESEQLEIQDTGNI